jgi:hypothetical protein
MKVRFLFAWYDVWVGAYWDRAKRSLYVMPLPMLGIVFDFGMPESHASTCSARDGFDYEPCTCGFDAAWRKRNEYLRSGVG